MDVVTQGKARVAREASRLIDWAERAGELAPLRLTDRRAYIEGMRALVNEGCPQALIAEVLGISRQTVNYTVLRAHGTRAGYDRTRAGRAAN